MDLYIDEKDKELGRARLSQVGEGASAWGGTGGDGKFWFHNCPRNQIKLEVTMDFYIDEKR